MVNVEKYRILEKMVEIDDIAHERDMILENLENGYNKEWDIIFHKADYNYHKAQDRNEKYTAAKALVTLMKEQCKFLIQLGFEYTEEKNKVIEIEKEMNQLQRE